MTTSSRVFLFLLALGVGPCGTAWAEEAVMGADKPILLSPVTISEKTTRRKVYDAKVENLWDAKRHGKTTISYVEVLEAAYDTSKFDIVQCLLAKKAYRETVAKDRMFYCNYGAAAVQVPVKWKTFREHSEATKMMKTDEGTTAKGVGFDFTTRAITLAPDAPIPFLLLASGTALSAFPSKAMAGPMKDLISAGNGKQITDHVEYELRLQDFNRYYATFTGTPIMTPLDAVHGLAMFGHVAKKPVVAKILAKYGIQATEAQIDAALVSEKVKRDGKTSTFELAYRLVDGVSARGYSDTPGGKEGPEFDWEVMHYQVEDGLNQKSSAEYEAMLEQIIIEAPGHI